MTFQIGSQVTATGYNSILTTVTSVLTTFYGVTTYASSVSSSALIKATDWQNLYNDIDRALVHQTGNHLTYPSVQKGNKIKTAFANSLTTSASTIFVNKANVDAGQLVLDPVVSTSARTAVWNSEIIHKIQYSWNTDADAQYFFNQGGYIQPTVDIALLDNSTTTNTNWVSLINNVKNDTAFQNYRYNRTAYNGSLANYSKTETAGSISTIFTKVNGRTIQAQVNFSPVLLTNYMTVYPTASLNEYYSTDVSGGVLAPRPAAQLIETLNVGGAATYAILGFTPVSAVNINQYATTTFTITINNSGTGDLTLSSFSFTSDTGTTLTSNSIVANTMVINPSNIATITVTLNASTASAEGLFNGGYVTVYSDSVTGSVKIPVPVNVIQPIFAATSNPTSVTATVTQLLPQQTNFTFSAGTYGTIGSISASISNTTYFTITNNQSYGFYVVFIPPESASTTVTATLSVTLTPVDTRQSPVTLTIPFTYTVQIINSNISTWTGPYDNYNNVLGMSYDIINGIRTLTVGYGTGNDGGGAITGGSPAFVSTYLLGKAGDPSPSKGLPLYNSTTRIVYSTDIYDNPVLTETFGSLLQTYGAWITPSGGSVYNSVIDISYTINFPSTGSYVFKFSSYGSGEVFFNGTSLTSYNDSSSNSQGTFNVSYTALNTIRFVINSGGGSNGSGFAFVISDLGGTTIWSTNTPKRTAYQYWQEVYRIPLTLGNHTYQSASYLVKATDEAGGYTYGYWCGSGTTARSLFSITDDGNGNLSFNMNPWGNVDTSNQYVNTTLYLSQYMQYYYSEAGTRIQNLEQPIGGGSTTHYFLGFDRNGGIQTSIAAWPTRPTESSGGGGGTDLLPLLIGGFFAIVTGVCFTGESVVNMADGTVKRIDEIKVGDYVLNKDRTSSNKVLYVEETVDTTSKFLFTPDNIHKPFITNQHPIYIDDELSAVDPEYNYSIFPWLGKPKQLIPADTCPIDNRLVYNLYLEGDGTYIVNNYGVHNILYDGGALRLAIEQDLLTQDQAQEIMYNFNHAGIEMSYGSYIGNKILGFINFKPLTRLVANALTNKNNTLIKKLINIQFKVIGKIICTLKGIK
jgi:hypothetical protein